MATSSPTGKPRRLRSLYWRAVLGFSACIAVVLSVQALAVAIWVKSAPSGAALRLYTQQVADDLGRAIAAEPGLDVQRYVDARYPSPFASLYIITSDRRVVLRGPLKPPDASVEGGLDFYRANPHPAALPPSWSGEPFWTSEIRANGAVVGGVGVVPPSWSQLLGWKMALLSFTLLLAATLLAVHVIFGTVRRRVAHLEEAAARCGAGDFTSRAPEGGSDEIAGLAVAFNRMASDLGARDEQLKAADRTRRLLLADVSHELMTPLTAVRAYREVLGMSALASDPDVARCLGIIGDETQRMERLIGDLLDLARLEAGGERLRHEDVSVEDLFGRVAVRHAPYARTKGVSVNTTIGAGAEILYGDTMRLEQALQNLAANALRHTPAGGVVDVSAELRGDQVILAVRDTGQGIPLEHLPFVFDRFYKVDPARSVDDAAGSGLGLSIVKAIVERHGGTVSVSSRPGVSTVFTILLPLPTAA